MAWRGGALAAIAGGLFVPAALALGPPGPPIVPIGPPSPTPSPGAPGLQTSLSPRQAGARPVALTVSFRAMLICGRPRGAATVTLPGAARVPERIPADAVRINGRPAGAVAVHGSTITVEPARPKGMTCFSITEGVMRISFTRAASLGNPTAGGDYPLRVRHGAASLLGTLTIDG